MKTALVLEGGALRTIYSSGVCDAFLDGGLPLPDYTLGVSAGIAYGVSYLSRQSRRNLQLICRYANDRRYMGFRNLANPKNRSYFGLKFAYETIPNELIPFDYDAFAAYPGRAEAVVTNLLTGEAEYLPVPRRDSPNLQLEATCAIPLMFPTIYIGGQPYLDGGCADAIPWRRAFQEGCGRVVVGVLVAILQAVTQIHEQTISFILKLIVVVLFLIIGGSWMMSTLQEFFYGVFELIRG